MSFTRAYAQLLSEMPVRHFKAAARMERELTTDNNPDRRVPWPNFRDKSYEGYVSPKYMGIVSDKLSRLSGYNMNIFIIEGMTDRGTAWKDKAGLVQKLSKAADMPVSELSDAINFVMSGNNTQKEFSPWLYMHQLGEAINSKIIELDESGGTAFEDFYNEISKLVPYWIFCLKMGSAREAKKIYLSGELKGVALTNHVNQPINDLPQELITEFLWHGGRVRFDYPNDVDKREVDAAFEIFYAELRGWLDVFVGDVLFNDNGINAND